jgi:steroid delta-isomerase-like uncharacterized protein
MSAEDNKALVRRFYDEFYNGRAREALDKFFSGDYVHHPADLPSRLMDYADFKKREIQFLDAFPDLSRDIEDMVAEGDRVATRSMLKGKQTGDLPNLPAKGKQIEVRSIVIYRVADGKIAEGWECYDSLSMMMQLDVIHMVSTLSRARHERGDLPPGYVWPE